jgi:hypothetical protein
VLVSCRGMLVCGPRLDLQMNSADLCGRAESSYGVKCGGRGPADKALLLVGVRCPTAAEEGGCRNSEQFHGLSSMARGGWGSNDGGGCLAVEGGWSLGARLQWVVVGAGMGRLEQLPMLLLVDFNH